MAPRLVVVEAVDGFIKTDLEFQMVKEVYYPWLLGIQKILKVFLGLG
jgi:hypothetical protein